MKNKFIAIGLSFLGGFLGLQHFYLGNIGKGVLSVVFSFTTIPFWVGILNAIKLLQMPQEDFDYKYNRATYEQNIVKKYSHQLFQNQPKVGISQELEKLANLMDKGLISFEDFERQKAKLLK
ncbi:MAG: NINE protein [Thermonemataceae bacterium]|nr:NINE protein [Thermonemataceae bacterium]